MSTRWCGMRARTPASGLAVPMSMPRYTCAESTLTISPPSVPASAIATALLPAAVGPISSTTGVTAAGGSAAAHEEAVEIAERQPVPRRPAVVALAGALSRLHLAQQRVHLRQRQRAMRAHRGVAGHRREEIVAVLREHGARAELTDVVQHGARERDRVGIGQQRRNRAHGER